MHNYIVTLNWNRVVNMTSKYSANGFRRSELMKGVAIGDLFPK
jgi:hypothetical protein